jgi:ABC-2 type transport system ATP-binding protein
MDGPAIAASGLSMRFNGFLAVDGVDLRIEKGELFGLLGPNGAGKSTIIKMLTTMLRPSAGSAAVWGYDVTRERDAVRSSIGVVFQDPSVDSQLSGRENLDFHGRMYGMDRKTRAERIAEVLELVDLTEKADVLMEDYSGGMQRRLEIARGLMHHPSVLFLDEPTLASSPRPGGTSAVHPEAIVHVGRGMRGGSPVVLKTHFLEEADHLCEEGCHHRPGVDRSRWTARRGSKSLIGADIVTLVVEEGGRRRGRPGLADSRGGRGVDRAGSTLQLRVTGSEAGAQEASYRPLGPGF